MTAIRQILILPLLVLCVECTWPWLMHKVHSKHRPMRRLSPLRNLGHILHNGILKHKSLLRDQLSDIKFIIKRITVRRYDDDDYYDEYFPGYSYEEIYWFDDVPDRNYFGDYSSDFFSNSAEFFNSGEFNYGNYNFGGKDSGKLNKDSDVNKIHSGFGDKNKDLNDKIGDKNDDINTQPFERPTDRNADEDLPIDPRRDEVETVIKS